MRSSLRPRPIWLHTFTVLLIGFTLGLASMATIPWILASALYAGLTGTALRSWFRRRGYSARTCVRLIVALVAMEALVVIYAIVPTIGAYAIVHPARISPAPLPTALGWHYQSVTLKTSDDLQVEAWYLPSSNRAALIAAHGLDGNRTHVIPYLSDLVDAGYGVLLIDLRAHGESEGTRLAGVWELDRDILAALSHLQAREDVDGDRIGAFGLSAGAAAVLFAAARDPGIAAVWADGTGQSRTSDLLEPPIPELGPQLGVTPINWMYHKMISLLSGVEAGPALKTQIPAIAPRPIIFVAGAEDRLEVGLARRYQGIYPDSYQLWIIPGVGHLGGIIDRPEEYRLKMLQFFDTYLLRDGR